MKLLAFVDRYWPCDHSFIEEVLAKDLPKRKWCVDLTIKADTPLTGHKSRWHGAGVTIIDSPFQELAALRQKSEKSNSKGIPTVIFIRNRPFLCLIAALLPTTLPLVFQISHFKGLSIWLEAIKYPGLKEYLRAIPAAVHFLLTVVAAILVDQTWVVSPSMKRDLDAWTRGNSTTRIVPLGAPAYNIRSEELSQHSYRREIGVGPNIQLLVYVGTFNRIRELDTLIYMMDLLTKRTGEIHLAFVGGGPREMDRERLENITQNHDLESFVHFTGKQSRSDLVSILCDANLGLSYFPNNRVFEHNSPIKVADYLATGLPVVCTDQPDQAKMVRCCGGGVVADGYSAKHMAIATYSALTLNWDRESIRKAFLQRRGYKHIGARASLYLEEVF